MVLSGIQPPEKMHKPAAEHSLSISCNATPLIPAAAGRASPPHFIFHSYTPLAQNSAIALFGAHKDSPPRSAGSFNIVHPIGKALLPAEHRLTSDIDVVHDENDMVMCCGKPSIHTAVGAPLSLLSPCFIDAYTWEDQPFLDPIIPTSNSNIHSQSVDHAELLELAVISRDCESHDCNSAAEAISKESTGSILFFTKQEPPKPGEILWSKELDSALGEHDSCRDLFYFTRQETEHESLTILLDEESQLHRAPSPPPLSKQSSAHSGSMMAEGSGITHSCGAACKPFLHGGNIEGRSSLVRSCSLSSISPTRFLEVVEESPPSITAASLSNKGAREERRKRSFSAIELSSAELSSCGPQGMKPHKMQRRRRRRRQYGLRATDPESRIEARTRREKLSKKIRILQSLVPNGERLDTVSMLRQTLEYIRFLQYQLGETPDDHSITSPSLTTTSNCHKWKAFMETHSTTTSTISSTVTSG